MARQSRSPFLTIAEAAELLRLKKHTLDNMRWQGPAHPFASTAVASSTIAMSSRTGPKAAAEHRLAGARRKSAHSSWRLAAVALHAAPLYGTTPCSRLERVAQRSQLDSIGSIGPLRVGDLVLIRLTGPSRRPSQAAAPICRESAYLLKPVPAVAGDRVCRFGTAFLSASGSRRSPFARDSAGRPMPIWQGCRTSRAGELFLLADIQPSFDSRYFGAVRTEHVVGRAVRFGRRRPTDSLSTSVHHRRACASPPDGLPSYWIKINNRLRRRQKKKRTLGCLTSSADGCPGRHRDNDDKGGPALGRRPRAVGLYRAAEEWPRDRAACGVSAHSGYDPSRALAAPCVPDHVAQALTRGLERGAIRRHCCAPPLPTARLFTLSASLIALSWTRGLACPATR